MRERGTTRQTVVDTAVEMMERDGLDLLSLHKLPAELGIRAPSLHTSIHSLDHLRVLIAEIALRRLEDAVSVAVEDRRMAVRNLILAYCEYAGENPEMYRVITAVPRSGHIAGSKVKAVLFKLLAQFTPEHPRQVQLSRELHSGLHRFAGLGQLGFFDSVVPTRQTIREIADNFASRLPKFPDEEVQDIAFG